MYLGVMDMMDSEFTQMAHRQTSKLPQLEVITYFGGGMMLNIICGRGGAHSMLPRILVWANKNRNI